MAARGDNFDSQPDNFAAFTVDNLGAVDLVGSRDASVARAAQGHFQMTIGTGLAFGDFELSGFAQDAAATGLTMNFATNPPNNNIIDIFIRDPATGGLTDPAAAQVSVRRVAHA